MTDEQFKQLMERLDAIEKRLPPLPAFIGYPIPTAPQPPFVACDPTYPNPLAPYAGTAVAPALGDGFIRSSELSGAGGGGGDGWTKIMFPAAAKLPIGQ